MKSSGGGAGEGGVGAEDVLGLEDKVLGWLPYKESVSFHFYPGFPMVSSSPNFVAFITSKFLILF
jgi:hypothetical protein